MRNELKMVPIALIVVRLLSGCGNDGSSKQNIPPPPPPDNRCGVMKANTYQSMLSGEFEIVFNDTFNADTWSAKRHYLDSILEHYFHLLHTPVFNNNYKSCVQPIMDSAIAAKYGANAKDSIINEAYRLTEIVYKKENKE